MMREPPESWMRGSAVLLTSADPCCTAKAGQQMAGLPKVAPKPRLMVVNVLPFTAWNSGPFRSRNVSAVADGDRRTLTSGPAELTWEASKPRSGTSLGPNCRIDAPSRRLSRPKVLLRVSPARNEVLTDETSGPCTLRPAPPSRRITPRPALTKLGLKDSAGALPVTAVVPPAR